MRTGGDLRERVQRLAAAGGDLTEMRAGLDRALRRTVGYDAAALSTLDPATFLFTSCFVTGLSPDETGARERALFDLEFRGGDVNTYAALAQAAVPVGRLHAATGGDIGQALRYRQLLHRLDVVDELRVVLRARDVCWGTLTLYRRGDARPFTEADEARLAAVVAPVADLFRLTLLRAALAAPQGVDDPPGVVLVGADGSARATSATAAQWLDAIDDRGRIPSALQAVVAAARAGDGLARAALPARDGRWVVLHGSPVKDEGGARDEVAVIVEGARPIIISEVIAGAYGLTAREREITQLAAQGRSTKQMAAALGISPFTVQDHMKAVFAKTGVQSRGELVATIFAQHYEPRRAAAATPSPYGWYLDEDVAAAG